MSKSAGTTRSDDTFASLKARPTPSNKEDLRILVRVAEQPRAQITRTLEVNNIELPETWITYIVQEVPTSFPEYVQRGVMNNINLGWVIQEATVQAGFAPVNLHPSRQAPNSQRKTDWRRIRTTPARASYPGRSKWDTIYLRLTGEDLDRNGDKMEGIQKTVEVRDDTPSSDPAAT
ncbi:hypothetical protein F5X97DRAFT_319310 [Nemania serpens]|nr:hypothetical protein F5X97DRAFT_319310 [Nemania serpens]